MIIMIIKKNLLGLEGLKKNPGFPGIYNRNGGRRVGCLQLILRLRFLK
jgi:hypothetical protein